MSDIEKEINQKAFQSSYQKAIINVLFTSGWLKRSVQDLLKPYKITHAQFNVLRILNGKYPEACNPGEIVDVMIEKMADVTRLLDRLKSKDLIRREVCPSNRRKLDVYITENGKKLLAQIEPAIQKHHAEFHRLTPAEAEQLSALLDKFRG